MGFPLSFLFIIKLNDVFFLRIVLQDKYTIVVLTVNIKFTWFRGSPVSKPRHINSIFTVNTPIFYKCIQIPLSGPVSLHLSYTFCRMSKIGSSNMPRDNKGMSLCRHFTSSTAYSMLYNGTAISRYLEFHAQIKKNI